MKNKKLHDDLKKLRNEINNVATDDIESRKKLNQILSDLQEKLEKPDNNDEGLVKDLKETIRHFEAEHPRATAILNDIMVTLSNMGI